MCSFQERKMQSKRFNRVFFKGETEAGVTRGKTIGSPGTQKSIDFMFKKHFSEHSSESFVDLGCLQATHMTTSCGQRRINEKNTHNIASQECKAARQNPVSRTCGCGHRRVRGNGDHRLSRPHSKFVGCTCQVWFQGSKFLSGRDVGKSSMICL